MRKQIKRKVVSSLKAIALEFAHVRIKNKENVNPLPFIFLVAHALKSD